MDIIITDRDTISEIKTEFNKHFPFLKLEFFEANPYGENKFSPQSIIKDDKKTIGEIRHIHHPVSISINAHLKVSSLEVHFREYADIYLQVFRKSGNVWLETTSTDDWTLAEQNKKGEEMSKPVPAPESDDYHEQE